MVDILNLAIPYFGLIFIGFACGRTKGLPEAGLAWMNFFLLYVSLPALLFGIMSKTPFSELNNPPFLIATTASRWPCSAARRRRRHREHHSLLHTLGIAAKQIVLNPLIMSACAGALAAG